MQTHQISSTYVAMNDDLILTKKEFLTDSAQYFLDKKSVYVDVKQYIASELNIAMSMIRICGSAYWGRSYSTGEAFRAGLSDLDVAIVDPCLFVRLLSEVRALTWNFTNLTKFPTSNLNAPATFQDYIYKKGIVRLDLMPRTKSKVLLGSVSDECSRQFAQHFSKVTFAVYDSEHSFAVKQINPTKKFRGHAL